MDAFSGFFANVDEECAAPSPTEAPWCLLLAPDLPFGAVEWWRPRQLVLLRSTCKAFRSGQSHEESLFNVLTAGLGAPEKVWTRITNASALYDLCHRLFEERLLIATLPKVAAAAAGLSSADPMARHCALTSGGFSLHRYMRDVEGQIPKWKPSDCDVFIPCGCAHDAPIEELERSQAVWDSVLDHVQSSMLSLFPGELVPGMVTVRISISHDGYMEEREVDLTAAERGAAFAEGYAPSEAVSSDGEAALVTDEDAHSDDDYYTSRRSVTVRYEQRPKEQTKTADKFREPRKPNRGHVYSMALLRRVARCGQGELAQYVGEHTGAVENLPHEFMPFWSTPPEQLEYLSSLQGTLKRLDACKMLEPGPHGDTAGLPRAYKIARVVHVTASLNSSATSKRIALPRREFSANVSSDDRRSAVRASMAENALDLFPRSINVIQYHGAPITALQLTGSFDLPPPQVTVCVDAGSARPRFELTPLAEEALRSRVLRPHKYTWGACYVPPSLRDEREEDVAMPKHVLREHGPVYNQLQRIVKYVERGFSLPDAAAQA